MTQDILARAARIRLVVFDVDGVLTDGCLYLGDDGREYKAFHTRDGLGLKLLKDSGVEVAIITGRSSPVVAERMAELDITHVYQGRTDKLPIFQALLGELGLASPQAAFVGDDVQDLPVLSRVGLGVAVADAHPLVAKHAHWQTPSPGGRGAARDVCELILEAQGRLERAYKKYLS